MYPADIVVSTHNFNTPFHFHALPVLNVYIASAGLLHQEEMHSGKLRSGPPLAMLHVHMLYVARCTLCTPAWCVLRVSLACSR